MNKLGFSKTTLGFLFCLLSGMACTRPESRDANSSKIMINIPQGMNGLSAQGSALPSDKKACYGVKVKGPGITSLPQVCGADLGLYSGFVEAGGSFSFDLPKGDNRSFELIIHLVGLTESCPAWDEKFGSYLNQLQSTYSAGKTEGVSIKNPEETISITMNFPGVANHIASTGATACSSRLKGKLYSNGDVYDNSGNLLTGSSPMNESFYSTTLSTDIYGVGFITAGGLLNIGSALPIEIPPHVYSVTRKPDSGVMYGLVGGGQVVMITPSLGTATVTELDSTNCPFTIDNCKVPMWMQSISAGFGTDIYSLDHAGSIYKLSSGEVLTATGDSVSETVTQISYY